MASIRRVGKKWIAEIRTKGKYASKLHETKNQAVSWAAAQEHLLGKDRLCA